MSGRDCGTCRVCCALPDIPELEKPLDTLCRFASRDPGAAGCTRYGSRPDVCRDFSCGWLSGLGEAFDRPDKLGVMWQPIEMPDGGPGLAFVEVWPGALQQPRVVEWLRRFEALKPGRIIARRSGSRQFSAVEVRVGGKRLDGLVTKVKATSEIEVKPGVEGQERGGACDGARIAAGRPGAASA